MLEGFGGLAHPPPSKSFPVGSPAVVARQCLADERNLAPQRSREGCPSPMALVPSGLSSPARGLSKACTATSSTARFAPPTMVVARRLTTQPFTENSVVNARSVTVVREQVDLHVCEAVLNGQSRSERRVADAAASVDHNSVHRVSVADELDPFSRHSTRRRRAEPDVAPRRVMSDAIGGEPPLRREYAAAYKDAGVDADHQRLVTAIAGALQLDGRVDAAFLTGSLASGRADRFSDVDLLVFAPDDMIDVVAQDAASLVDSASPVVDDSCRRIGGSWLLNCVLATGGRVDIVAAPASAATVTPRWGPVRALFDRVGIEQQLPEPSAPYRIEHDDNWLLELTRGVLRTLLLLPMVAERREWLRGAQHVQLLKQDLLELLLYRSGDPPLSRPGVWAWSELSDRLAEPARQLVEDLPPAAATAEAVVSGHLAVAEVFLRLARTTLPRDSWPIAYEQAIVEFLRRNGFELVRDSGNAAQGT